jgi:hypothetical protein
MSQHRLCLRSLDRSSLTNSNMSVCCNQAWLLKNSLAELPPKMCRVRMPYKRSSPISDTFLVTPFGSVFRQIVFFNSHRRLHQLRIAVGCWRRLGEPFELLTIGSWGPIKCALETRKRKTFRRLATNQKVAHGL